MDYRPKKGLDIWLNDKGYYRKHVAMDETCFFRAVSDQIYNTQIYHEDIRKLCVTFATRNRELFKNLLSDSEWNEHLEKLQKHFVVCGDIEIHIVSKMLKRDFIIVDANNFTTENVTKNGYEKLVTLCKMRDNHYDSVCAKNHIDNSGFCQSLVYKLLYEEVFGFEDVDDLVQTMLYPEDDNSQKNSNLFDSIFPSETDDKDDISKNPPFPYKVAKALDPNQYRNIEFDAWNQTRKELRLQDWYLGGEDFKVGTKCLLVVENNTFDSYIQELNYKGKQDVCLVYVVEWASKEIVKREELMPLPDAKPWPLPYGIARNTKCEDVPSVTAEIVEEPKPAGNKKRRNRRRAANHNNNSVLRNDDNNNTRDSVNCYEGCPLVASSSSQFVDENLHIPANQEGNLDNNINSTLLFEPLMPLQLDSNYSLPYESNNNNSEENHLEDQSFNDDSFVTEADWTNYQTWLSSGSTPTPSCVPIVCCTPIACCTPVACCGPTSCCTPVPYPAPYLMPTVCVPNVNPQMFVVHQQFNTLIQQENADTKVTTMCTNYMEKTYLNNNQPVPNLNYQLCPNQIQVMPCPNYSVYQPQTMPSPNYSEYEYSVTPRPSYPDYEVYYNQGSPAMPGPYMPTMGPMMPMQGPIMPTQGPIMPSQGPIMPTHGPTMPMQGPTMPTQGPVMPTSELVIQMMPTPPPTPDISVSPMPMPIYSQPMGPMTAICPVYLVVNPVPVPQPNLAPQTNMPMLEPNVPVSQLTMLVTEDLASKLRINDCNNPDPKPNFFNPGYFSEYNLNNS